MTPDQRRASAWTPLADLAKLNETSVDMVKACLHAAGIEPMAITHDKGIEDMAPYGKAMDAIASHRGKFTPAMSTDEVVRKVVAKLIPELSSTIRILLNDAAEAANGAGRKAQNVVDTVLTQAESIVGMQRKTNEAIAAQAKQVNALSELVQMLSKHVVRLGEHVQTMEQSLDRLQVYAVLPSTGEKATKPAAKAAPKPAPAKKAAARKVVKMPRR